VGRRSDAPARAGRRPRPGGAGAETVRGLAFLLALLAVVPYAGSVANELVWDDRLHLLANPRTAGAQAALRFFGEPEGLYHRPLVFLSFGVENSLWPAWAVGFHLTNLALHALNAVLLFTVARRSGVEALIAFGAAAFFAVHPLQSEAVAYVSGRTDLLVTTAALSVAGLALRTDAPVWWRSLLVAVATAVAVLSKESGYALVPLVALLAWRHERDWRRALALTLPAAIVAAAGVLMRPAPLPTWPPFRPLQALAAVGRTALEYVELLVWPVGLQVDRIVPAPGGGEVLACAAIALLLAGGALALAARAGPVGDWAVWSVALYLPVANLVPLYPDIVGTALFVPEHNLYAPMAGIAVLLGLALRTAASHLSAGGVRVLRIAAALVLVALALRTAVRVRDWRDERELFGSAAAAGSRSPRIWYNYGNALMASEETRAAAIDAYRVGLQLAPNDALLWLNLGVALHRSGEYAEARRAYERSLAIAPSPLAARNLAALP